MVVMNKGTILFEGTPSQAQETVQGKIWKKMIERSEFEVYRNNYTVISSKSLEGKLAIHVYAEMQPDGGFESVASDLEDVYFTTITKN